MVVIWILIGGTERAACIYYPHLPPLFIQVGTAEVLYDDGTRLAARARAAGVVVTLDPWADMIHDWQLFPDVLPEAQETIARLGEFACKHAA